MSVPDSYSDLAVTIEPDGNGRLQTRLLEAPGSFFGGGLKQPFTPPCHRDEVESLVAALDPRFAGLSDSGAEPGINRDLDADHGQDADEPGAGPGSGSPDQCPCSTIPERIGDRLFDALFQGQIRDMLDLSLARCDASSAKGLRIRLVIDPECPESGFLAALPWELMYCRERRSFLSRSPVTPIIRHLDVGQSWVNEPGDPPIKVLVAMANPVTTTHLDLHQERLEISELEQRWHEQVKVQATFVERATIKKIRTALNSDQYDVFHFMGHGQIDEHTGRAALLLEDGSGNPMPFPADELVDCLRGRSSPRLVVLNACSTGAMPRYTGVDPYTSIAAALILDGYPAVLAMQVPISDPAAIRLAAAFYGALARDNTLEAAVTEARLALMNPKTAAAEWAIPVLYMQDKESRVVNPNRSLKLPPELRINLIPSAPLIAARTEGFVGRGFVFRSIDECINGHRRGYMVLTGEPGIGKTAIIAEMVRRRKLCHHFIVRQNIKTRSTSDFLPNICTQLILDHNLPYKTLRADAAQSSAFFVELLEEISGTLDDDGRLLVLLDALDEVHKSERQRSSNLFDLPPDLPDKVFMVLTARGDRYRKLPLSINDLRKILEIPSNSAENLEDAETYIRSYLDRERVVSYIANQRKDTQYFVDELTRRSKGNFMYLRCVLESIASPSGHKPDLEKLPAGLANYYELLWDEMKELGEHDWHEYKLPVLTALAVARRPVSVGFISRKLGISRSRIISVLVDWQPVLHRDRVETAQGIVSQFSLHHSSFYDFLRDKDEIAGEQVGLREMRLTLARKSTETLT